MMDLKKYFRFGIRMSVLNKLLGASEIIICPALIRSNWKAWNIFCKVSENHKIPIYAKCAWRILVFFVNLNFVDHFQPFLFCESRASDFLGLFFLLKNSLVSENKLICSTYSLVLIVQVQPIENSWQTCGQIWWSHQNNLFLGSEIFHFLAILHIAEATPNLVEEGMLNGLLSWAFWFCTPFFDNLNFGL